EFDVFRVRVSSANYGVGRRKRNGFGEVSREFNVEEFPRGGAEVASARAGKSRENICDGWHRDTPQSSATRGPLLTGPLRPSSLPGLIGCTLFSNLTVVLFVRDDRREPGSLLPPHVLPHLVVLKGTGRELQLCYISWHGPSPIPFGTKAIPATAPP